MGELRLISKVLVFVGIGLLCVHAQASPVIPERMTQEGYRALEGHECVYVKIPDTEDNKYLYDFPSLAIREGLVVKSKPDDNDRLLYPLKGDMVAKAIKKRMINGYVAVIDDEGNEGWIKDELLVPFIHRDRVGYRIIKNTECIVLYKETNQGKGRSLYFFMSVK